MSAASRVARRSPAAWIFVGAVTVAAMALIVWASDDAVDPGPVDTEPAPLVDVPPPPPTQADADVVADPEQFSIQSDRGVHAGVMAF